MSFWESSSEYSFIAEDLDGNIIAWNEGAKRYYGYDKDEVLGKNAFILNDPVDVKSGKSQAIIDEVSKNGRWSGNIKQICKDGEKFTAHGTITKRYDKNHNLLGFTFILHSISDSKNDFQAPREDCEKVAQDSKDDLKKSQHNLKESERDLDESEIDNERLKDRISIQNKRLITINKELVKQNERAQEASRLKSEFLANMSHELRTPLNAIIGFSQLLDSGRTGTLLPKQKEYLSDIITSSNHLLQLINDVLDLSKVEAGKMEFYPETFDVKRTINEVCNILKTLILSGRLTLKIEIDPKLDTVILDPSKFKQLLYNFLSNAIKFSPEHGIVTIRAFLEGNNEFKLEVEDKGVGVRPEDVKKLFVEFQQLGTKLVKEHPGTGLGLAISRRIVEAQGGKIGVISEFGKGSCFFAILPRGDSAQLEKTKSLKRAEVAENISPQTILLIEDDLDDCNDIKRILIHAGYSVKVAKNGAEAIKLCKTHKFSAITLDLILPDMSGFDILRVLRSSGPNKDVPVIVTSVVAEKPAALGYHIHDFLVKPVSNDELVTSLKKGGVYANEKQLVLVIDEDPNSLQFLKKTMTECGYQVMVKPDGKSGLVSVEEDLPSIIILDILMPDLDGFEFLHELKQLPNGQDIPVIIWTNKSLSKEEKTILRASCDAVIEKNDGSGNLLIELSKHLPKIKAIGHER